MIGLILFSLLPATSLAESTVSRQQSTFMPLKTSEIQLPRIQARSKAALRKGMFLVADPRLRDPNFSESVVLLVRYGRNGALGLIINRPSEVDLSTVFPEKEWLRQRTDKVHVGGPVELDQAMFLVRSETEPEDSVHVFADVYVSSNPKVLKGMIENKVEKFRVYAGYAGWAPRQLDHEMSRGDWHALRADVETIFEKPSGEIWPELIRFIYGKWVKVTEQITAGSRIAWTKTSQSSAVQW
jgi:putative transcriptional regulator